MKLRQLRNFVAVAGERNFARAAERMNLAQPSLSRHIQLLEDDIGVQLLRRDRQTVELTEAGEQFLGTARRALTTLEAGYLNLRIITSIEDARVKFSGHDRIDNIIGALNDNLRSTYGIEIMRGSMPSANNDILLDLEAIRTLLKEIEAMTETQQVRVEAAVKQVESQLRTRRKETQSRAFDLQQAKVRLDTSVAE